jgi:hypothetical protein
MLGPWTGSVGSFEVADFDQVTYTDNMDAGAELDFSISAMSAAAYGLSELATDVWLHRGTALEERFRVLTADAEWGESGEDRLAVKAVSYKRLLAWRHLQTALSYAATGQANIVAGLIAHAEAQPGGDLNTTVGSLDSGGINRDRQYTAGENIGKLLSDLSAVIDGPYWNFTAAKALIVKPSTSFTEHATPIVRGATARKMNRKSGAGTFANAAVVSGDSQSTVPVFAASATVATDPRGRWEVASGFPSVILQSTLVEKANGVVADSETPTAQWSVSLDPARYDGDLYLKPGEYVNLHWPPAVFRPVGLTGAVRCQTMTVKTVFNADGATAVDVELFELEAA